jgi:Carboxypeptidase regulatory-like domain
MRKAIVRKGRWIGPNLESKFTFTHPIPHHANNLKKEYGASARSNEMKSYLKLNTGLLVSKALRIGLLIVAAIAIVVPISAQDVTSPAPAPALATALERGHLTGTVTDVNNDTVPDANVVLAGPALKDPRTVVSDNNGAFKFDDVDPGTYTVTITAAGFGNWTSPAVTVVPGQFVILNGSKLKIAEALTSVSVTYSPEKAATEQIKREEQQRVFGFVPNFYVVYDHDPEPLSTKLKFQLAFRTSIDPVTIGGVGVLAAIHQAADIPNYRQGWNGYGERFGSAAADGISDIMIGGAILPSLLHQDPRYFYQGTGSKESRVFHALSSPFVCRGDNGRLQANYSSVGGDLSSAAISNLYYPASNRGAGLVLSNFAISTGERMLSSVIQEFVLPRLTSRPRAAQ